MAVGDKITLFCGPSYRTLMDCLTIASESDTFCRLPLKLAIALLGASDHQANVRPLASDYMVPLFIWVQGASDYYSEPSD